MPIPDVDRAALEAKCRELIEANQELYGTAVRLGEALERAQEYEDKFHQVMSAYRRTKMEHGLCEPVERNACTHCAAVRKLDKMLSQYKGRPVRLA